MEYHSFQFLCPCRSSSLPAHQNSLPDQHSSTLDTKQRDWNLIELKELLNIRALFSMKMETNPMFSMEQSEDAKYSLHCAETYVFVTTDHQFPRVRPSSDDIFNLINIHSVFKTRSQPLASNLNWSEVVSGLILVRSRLLLTKIDCMNMNRNIFWQ